MDEGVRPDAAIAADDRGAGDRRERIDHRFRADLSPRIDVGHSGATIVTPASMSNSWARY